ncbi:immunity-related GTPase family M protein 1 isoform 1 [Mus musculus]|uniref:Immunity-related GTPase family M protein 1 n=6 Tax=Mus TaxID=862507 RepID=IRGM1_MOUSE|nr:immunity-related GTPase family M protein 1 isoform 1 [Mus musculus]Q60766.1 RecName: Full=Immunity-related GTPase family M protein 1; AltName: Full=Interferon-inducible GTPase 3; AltName: Full=Interferon-inducible protein 1; AltName: Full=LPS-stimulated RAW 264.7 macrophage protein 47; Short=LRG-47 [Mus musculus]SDA08590.1 Immunity related GTPase family M member 1 [Mus musculus domesticus]AAB48942.1 LRG-47 [Mus musculus]AAI45958.1 Immunity-related GTPase family M member 1 [Mus musculus]EDL3|eukprot:NP_032352.1 immunity-related GTPase family M protein 1 [Mus musculus]
MKPSHSSCEAAPLLPNMAETHYAPLSSAFPFVTSYQTGSSRLPEVSRSTERALREGKLLELVYGIKETVATLSQIPVSIFVTGDSGNGMSSFINALRVIGHDEDASAPTGVVRTTKTRTEYSSSHFPNVVLWDLPGLGATAQTVEDYVEEMKFSTCDLFIIIASEQFSSNHVKLSKIIQSMGKRFYIVWTKLDRDLSTSVLSEVRLLQNIQENIRENLQKEKVKYPPVFLVSSLDPLLYDFPKLRDTLHKDLSNIRCCEPLKTLYGTYEKIVGDKVAVWKQRIANESLKNSLGVRDDDNMGECLKVYRLIFGVDDESVQQVAQSMGTVVMEYKDNMKSQNFYTLRREDWKLRLMTCAIVNAFFRLLRFLPCVCCCLRRLRHKRMLFLVAQDTKNILEKILRDSIFPPQI